MKRTIPLLVLSLGLVNSVHAFEVLPPSLHPGGGRPALAPEIDPAGAFSALTLLAGSIAVLRARRRR